MIGKDDFISLYHQKITRRGADRLLEWMEKADFFTAPASTRYHLACAGGLMQHSVHVFQRLEKLCAAEYGDQCPYSEETIAIAGLLHDLCKVNFYREDTRNVKENGVWYKNRTIQSMNRFLTDMAKRVYSSLNGLSGCRWKRRLRFVFIWADLMQSRATTAFPLRLKRCRWRCFCTWPICRQAIWMKRGNKQIKLPDRVWKI